MRKLVIIFLIFLMSMSWAVLNNAQANCDKEASATVISLQGNVAFDPNANGSWHEAQLNETLCEGGKIWVKPDSRMSLALPGNDVLRLNENTVLTLKVINLNQTSLLDIVKGFIHFISRKPKEVKIESGIANAAPLGTEFAFSVDNRKAALWVYEGGVKFYNQHGSVNLSSGQAAEALLGKAPQLRIDIKPQDAVNWALYYPPLLPSSDGLKAADPTISKAIDDYRKGRIDLALQALAAIAPTQQTPHFHKVRGALRLIVGQVDLAQQDIKAVQATNANDADALALQSVIALTQNRKDQAFELASKAVSSNPQSATAYTALSYAEQGRFNLEKAQAAADKAVQLAPQDAMALARKAELQLSQGLISDSEQTVQKAIRLDATLERTQTIKGFTHLMTMDTDEAKQAFNKAITLDSTSPLARLGLGLAKIRDGDLEAGRKDLEIAANLDPNNSLIRSYLGKAYYEEKRSDRAEEQFKLAKERDPKDPTPYFYDAIKKQTENRPVDALQSLQKSIELNNNRAVFRSKQNLDSDLAARSAALGRIFNDLGFGQRALVEGWKSVTSDPGDYSGHRLLADNYSALPRHELARTSELLQAQLLQPINVTPLQPQQAERNLAIVPGSGPAITGYNEFNPLFTRDGFSLQTSGVVGSLDTYGDEVVHSGLWKNFSYSLGQFHHQSNGFRPNNRINQNIYNAFVQGNVTQNLSLLAEYRHRDVVHGDLFYYGDLSFNFPEFKRHIDTDTLRLGTRLALSPKSNLIGMVYLIDHEDNFNKYFVINSRRKSQNGVIGEIQYSYNNDPYTIIIGAGGYDIKNSLSQNFLNLQTFGNQLSKIKYNTNYGNAYIYNFFKYPKSVTWTLGLNVETLQNVLNGSQDYFQFNPKLGFQWEITKKTTIRAAAFRALSRGVSVDATIEPTQVAGFNQLFDNYPATDARRYGIGIDHKLDEYVFIGAEASKRDLFQPILFLPEFSVFENKWEEQLLRAYLYWQINDYFSSTIEYQYDFVSENKDIQYKNHIIPIGIRFFDKVLGFGAMANLTYVNQNAAPKSIGGDENKNSNFALLDVALKYRLPLRYGTISFSAKNLLDKKFNFVGQDIIGKRNDRYEESPQFYPERTFFVNFTLAF